MPAVGDFTCYLELTSQLLNLVQNVATVKPVLSGHSKIDQAKALKTNGSLMKVESIAECSFDLH